MATFTPSFEGNCTQAPEKGEVLVVTILSWFIVLCCFLEVVASGTSFYQLCLHKNWKPYCICIVNLAVAKFFSSVFAELLPSLDVMMPTVFSFPEWMKVTTAVASSLGYYGSVVLMIAISMERSLMLLFRRLFNHFQTKQYSVLCTFLWIFTFLLSKESEFFTEDMETEGVVGEIIGGNMLQNERIENTLLLMNFIAFMVMLCLKIFRNFQKQAHRPYSKRFATIFGGKESVLLALGTVLWVQDYESKLFNILIPDAFLLYKQKWNSAPCFKKLLQKLFCHTPTATQRKDGTFCTAV